MPIAKKAFSPENFENIANLSPLIIGGDLNSFITPNLDAFSSKSKPKHKLHPVAKLIDRGFIDIFRHLYPEKKKFSRFGTRQDKISGITHISASRIDYFLVSNNLTDHVNEILIEELDVLDSDHQLLVMDVFSQKVPPFFENNDFSSRLNINNKDLWLNNYKKTINKYIIEHPIDTTNPSPAVIEALQSQATQPLPLLLIPPQETPMSLN